MASLLWSDHEDESVDGHKRMKRIIRRKFEEMRWQSEDAQRRDVVYATKGSFSNGGGLRKRDVRAGVTTNIWCDPATDHLDDDQTRRMLGQPNQKAQKSSIVPSFATSAGVCVSR